MRIGYQNRITLRDVSFRIPSHEISYVLNLRYYTSSSSYTLTSWGGIRNDTLQQMMNPNMLLRSY